MHTCHKEMDVYKQNKEFLNQTRCDFLCHSVSNLRGYSNLLNEFKTIPFTVLSDMNRNARKGNITWTVT
jgi:hypothetical protein